MAYVGYGSYLTEWLVVAARQAYPCGTPPPRGVQPALATTSPKPSRAGQDDDHKHKDYGGSSQGQPFRGRQPPLSICDLVQHVRRSPESDQERSHSYRVGEYAGPAVDEHHEITEHCDCTACEDDRQPSQFWVRCFAEASIEPMPVQDLAGGYQNRGAEPHPGTSCPDRTADLVAGLTGCLIAADQREAQHDHENTAYCQHTYVKQEPGQAFLPLGVDCFLASDELTTLLSCDCTL